MLRLFDLIAGIARPHPIHSVAIANRVLQSVPRDRGLLLVGFAGGFRRSELAQITPRDLTFSRNGVSITIRRSKTDAAGKGRVVALPSNAGDLCPVRALRDWLARLRSLNPPADDRALFRRIDRYGQLGGPLGAAATGPILQKRMALCGRPSAGFSAHSLRRFSHQRCSGRSSRLVHPATNRPSLRSNGPQIHSRPDSFSSQCVQCCRTIHQMIARRFVRPSATVWPLGLCPRRTDLATSSYANDLDQCGAASQLR